VPVPLFIVIVAEPVPVPVQEPVVVMVTGRPELAVAATGKVVLYTAVPGAAVVTVIVWLTVVTVMFCVTWDAGL
jgi:hypothetical protein